MPVDEVAGQTLGTLCVRAAPRDLFDVARLSDLALDWAIVRQVALFNGFLGSLDLSGFDPSLASRITQKEIADQVSPLLLASNAPSRDDLLERAEVWTNRLLPLDAGEREFAAGLLTGTFTPGGLFAHTRVHPRLSEHPGMMFRMKGPAETGRKPSRV